MDAQYQRKTLETKVACLRQSVYWNYGRHVVRPCSSAYAPTGNTASLDGHECNSWVLISTVLRLATLRVTELHYD